MIQKIYLILFALRRRDELLSFPEFIKSRIDWDIRSFLPEKTDFIDCNTYSDFYIDRVVENKYYDDDIRFTRQGIVEDKKVMELTFSSSEDLKFKHLPWLEDYINFMAGEYNFIGVLFPYIIKDGNEYTFRIPYRILTYASDNNGESDPMDTDLIELQKNALFIKHHFYKEEIPEKCYLGIAKIILLDKPVIE